MQMPTKGTVLFLLFQSILVMCSSLQITMLTANSSSISMYSNGLYNSSFVEQAAKFNCSMNRIYTYSQSPAQYQTNAPYILQFTNLTQTISLTIQTQYNHKFSPNISTSTCSESCNITLYNNCPSEIGQFNYFTVVQIQVQNLAIPFSYYVLCNNSFSTNTFQWGLVILMVYCLALIVLIVFYSKAWSMGGAGVKINYWIILIFWALVAAGGIAANFIPNVMQPIIEIVCLMVGIVGIWVCSNEIIYLFRIGVLQKGLQIQDNFKIRILDVLSVFIGVGVALGYYFSYKNWIINDVLCTCIIIAAIKIMKFTNLKIALFALVIGLAMQMAFVQYIHFGVGTSYNDLILNNYNYPFQLQLPTINPVYKQKCAWLPFTAIINPGVFMSYLRRFDISRNTNIYFLTAITVFVLGSVVWMVISIGSVHSWPFEIVTGPIMMGLVVVFAYKRREIRTLWEGSFYDEDFANRDGLLEIMDVINNEENSPKDKKEDVELIRGSLLNSLQINQRQDSDMSVLRKHSNMSDVNNLKISSSQSKSSQKS